jgi:VWFA-related protein
MAVAAVPAGAQELPRFIERVDVARVLVDVRIIDARGRPVHGLSADDVRVTIGGKPAVVESIQWVTGALREDERQPSRPEPAPLPQRPVDGRLIVFLFQKSMDPSRLVGLMRMLMETRTFLDSFTPADRMAVLSFDSRLRVWLDFTGDLGRVKEVIGRDILFGRMAVASESPFPSLLRTLGPDRVHDAHSVEDALHLLGQALGPLPGAKSVILVGHGFGRFGSGGVTLENNYDQARQALQDARASVFCLDVTNADSHSLEVGLQAVAEDTGGFFARTHLFGRQALDRLAAALEGHYVLLVERPALKSGPHRIRVKLVGRHGQVFARSEVVD